MNNVKIILALIGAKANFETINFSFWKILEIFLHCCEEDISESPETHFYPKYGIFQMLFLNYFTVFWRF